MVTGQTTDALKTAIAPVLERLGLELVDVELTGSGRARTLRVSIDRHDGPVDLETITAASEAVSPLLDDDAVGSLLPGPYSLEVSSPGLERPLRSAAHFRRVVGRPVSVKTRTEAGGLRRRGVVVAADDAGVDLDFDGTNERLTYDEIVQARTIFEWGAADKPPKRTRRKKQEAAR